MINLAGTTWLHPKAFEDCLLKMGQDLVLKKGRGMKRQPLPKTTLVVPFLVGESGRRHLRVKTIDQKEQCNLMSRKNWETSFERVERVSGCSKVQFFFGYEPEDLNHETSLGILVSYWGQDARVKKQQLSYEFARACLGVFGMGFGSRDSVGSHGLNQYCKLSGHGNKATVGSTAQAKEEVAAQQYYRKDHVNQLLQPFVRRKLNELSTNVFHISQQVNPYLMGMVGWTCTRKILTTGHVPRPKVNKKKEEKGEEDDKEDIVTGISNPSFGFVNASHIDKMDRLSKDQVDEWKALAKQKKWTYCSKVLDTPGFCLPTTCGYQFVFREKAVDMFAVKAFFAMSGLGLAMRIEDGLVHHFMGAMFAHQTCLCVCIRKCDGWMSASNLDDQLQVVGWGTSGGGREVAEAARAAGSHEVAEAARAAQTELSVAASAETCQNSKSKHGRPSKTKPKRGRCPQSDQGAEASQAEASVAASAETRQTMPPSKSKRARQPRSASSIAEALPTSSSRRSKCVRTA
jgi:hypothetical protein